MATHVKTDYHKQHRRHKIPDHNYFAVLATFGTWGEKTPILCVTAKNELYLLHEKYAAHCKAMERRARNIPREAFPPPADLNWRATANGYDDEEGDAAAATGAAAGASQLRGAHVEHENDACR